MKVWTKVHIRERSKQVEAISDSLKNYLYTYGPMSDICSKYNVSEEDKKVLDQYTANRIGGLVMLYLARDTARINDLVNKYNIPDKMLDEIIPEIEGYIER